MSRKNLSHDPPPKKNKRKNKSILSVERANLKKNPDSYLMNS